MTSQKIFTLSKTARIQQITATQQASLHNQQAFIQQVIRKNVALQAQESDIEQSAFLQASLQVAFAHQHQHQRQRQRQHLVSFIEMIDFVP